MMTIYPHNRKCRHYRHYRHTYERYLTLLPKINEAIGTMRLRDIRPMHLNNFYGKLSEPGVRIFNNKAVAVKDIQSLLKKMKMSKSALAKDAGVSPQVITSICRQQPVLKRAGEAVAKTLGKDYSKLFRTEVDQNPLSTKTVLEYHRLTCAILSQAEKEMLVPYNAAKKASPPKSQQKEVNYFQPALIYDILEALVGAPLKWQLVTHLLMITGARRGEIAGSKWSKFDMEKHRLKVDTALLNSTKIGIYETTTKTSNQRYIPLPDETFSLLKRYQLSQMELQLANGDRWVQTDFVFTKSDGSPVRPDTITQ